MRKILKTSAQIAGTRKFGYNAVDSTTRRRNPQRNTSSEAFILTPQKREIGSAAARDDRRNMSLLAWMVRKHLDNVSRFTPHFRIVSDDKAVKFVNDTVKRLLLWHGRRRQFDALGRHGRDEWMRMFEACKVLGGDAAGLKVKGGKLQGIEGDRIAKPTGVSLNSEADRIIKESKIDDEGIAYNEDGTRKAFCLCKRVRNTLEFERIIEATDMIFDGYWPERFDSNRGVSPLLTALNEAADVRETHEWHVLKAKAGGIFGFAFTRTGSDDIYPSKGNPETASVTTESNAYSNQVDRAMKSRGIINLDLDPGDSVTEIESKTPNPALMGMTRELIRSVLLALDIPFTMYDSLASSFSARIADRNEYEEACEWKREKNVDVLDEIYGGWLLRKWAAANLFRLGDALDSAKVSIEEVAAALRWVPAGRPWLDRSNEMSGHILALAAGVTSTPRICAAYGEDAYDVADEQREYLEKAGIPLLYAQGGQVPVNDLLRQAREGQVPEAQPADNNQEAINE